MRLDTSAQARRLASDAMRQALLAVTNQMDADLDELFLEKKWDWPNGETRRRSGELAGDPRNIYDLGALYNSERESTDIGEARGVITREWEALNESGQDYAPLVHDGTTKTEPRPWTDRIKTEQEQRYAQIFADEFVRRFQAP